MKTVNKSGADRLSSFFRTQPRVDKTQIFDSCTCGEDASESDVDVLVRFLKDTRVSLFSYASMQHKYGSITERENGSDGGWSTEKLCQK